jgi:hypothetical protein
MRLLRKEDEEESSSHRNNLNRFYFGFSVQTSAAVVAPEPDKATPAAEVTGKTSQELESSLFRISKSATVDSSRSGLGITGGLSSTAVGFTVYSKNVSFCTACKSVQLRSCTHLHMVQVVQYHQLHQ